MKQKNRPVILIRTDASIHIGTGHVMRCLALAEELRRRGADIYFVCRNLQGNQIELIKTKRFRVLVIPSSESLVTSRFRPRSKEILYDIVELKKIFTKLNSPVDWMIVDHYGIDQKWEMETRKFAKRLMVIDDLADRSHICDIILDQNIIGGRSNRYDGLLPPYCRKLFGPNFALLRNEFRMARFKMKRKTGNIKRIQICFGGSDPSNQTLKALKAILGFKTLMFDVIVGSSNPHQQKIKRICAYRKNINFIVNPKNMAFLMLRADLVIGGGGISTWERCCLGVPSLVLALAENQMDVSISVGKMGAAAYLGEYKDVTMRMIHEKLKYFVGHSDVVRKMAERATRIVDGSGAQRVSAEILNERN